MMNNNYCELSLCNNCGGVVDKKGQKIPDLEMCTCRYTDKYTWVEINFTGQDKMPKWARQFAVDSDWKVYFPAGIFPWRQIDARLCDDTNAIWHEDHLYVSTEFLKREYPRAANQIGALERTVIALAKRLT